MASLSQCQFKQWQILLDQRFGIEISSQRQVYLETRLVMRMREIACDDYDQFYTLMVGAEAESEAWLILVDRLTVHETQLFRDPAAFCVVEQYINRWLSQSHTEQALSIWSVGCATGEEPYSLACVVDRCLSVQGRDQTFTILASDISEPALTAARRGQVAARQWVSLPPEVKQQYLLQQYFLQQELYYQVRADIREKVHFTRLNALNPDTVAYSSMDIIFCQNLLIYFSPQRRQEIVEQLIQRLTPGGLLVLGISDMLGWTHHLLRPAYTSDVLAFTRR